MAKYKVLHFMLLMLLLVAYIFLDNNYIPVLLLTYLIVLCIDVIVFMCIRKKLTFNANVKEYMLIRNDRLRLRVDVHNKAILPFINCVMNVKYRYENEKKFHKSKFKLYVRPKERKDIYVELECKHCGHIEIQIERIIVEDYISFMARKIKDFPVHKTMIAPRPIIAKDEDVVTSNVEFIDSDEYSTKKPGNDPMEIFGIREYRQGDRINRIHWKLTSKMQEYIVKEYSLPIKTTDIILIEQSDNSQEMLDAIYEAAMSISLLLQDLEVIHRVGYFDEEENDLIIERIEDESDFIEVISKAYRNEKYQGLKILDIYDNAVDDNYKGNIYYVTGKIDEDIIDIMAKLSQKVIISLVYVGEKEPVEKLIKTLENIGIRMNLVGEDTVE